MGRCRPALTDILLYHALPGRVMAADVAALESADTVQGDTVAVSVAGNSGGSGPAQAIEGCAGPFLEVWPESHLPGFALRKADVFQSDIT